MSAAAGPKRNKMNDSEYAGRDRVPANVAQSISPAFDIIRTETVLSRFPVHNLSKKGNIDIHIVHRNRRGEVELRWEVSFNERYGQARQLAYKLDTLVVNRRIEEAGRPVPKLIRLGSLREIAERLDMSSNTNILKRALRQNASAFITLRVSYTNMQGLEKTIEADFTRYSVIFTGEKLPDKRRADAVYLNLHDVYWSILNEAPWRPLDYDYLTALTPAAQRFYEIISYRFYNALRFANLNASRIAYSEYCLYSAQQRYYDYEHFKKQMYKVHLPHRQSGYIAEVRYESMFDPEGRPDWMMCYLPGPKARLEFEVFTGGPCQLEATTGAHVENCSRDEEAQAPDPELLNELVKRGISEKQARALLEQLPSDQMILDQLEYADYRIASEPTGRFRNPPGFYVSVLRDNVAVPAHFETSGKRVLREMQAPEQLNFLLNTTEDSWREAKRSAVERYIRTGLTSEEYESMVAAKQHEYMEQYKAAADWAAETLRHLAENAVAVQLESVLDLPTLEEFQKCDQANDK